MTSVDVFIEISKGGNVKYEYHNEKKAIVCDRILYTPFKYPFNYGFIPNTLSEDGDPLDVVILMNDELIPGCYIRCNILGYLDTRDDEGNDPKLIVCPISKIDPSWKNVTDISNDIIDKHTLKKIKYFFEHYKDLEEKTVHVGKFYGNEKANEIYQLSLQRYQELKEK